MSAAKLFRAHSLEKLTGMEADYSARLKADPRSAYLRKRVDDIRWAITHHLTERRAASGDPVPTNGYSGRQTRRRR